MSNGKERRLEEDKEQLNQRALELLRSPDLLCGYLDFTERSGLVGEERNALAIFTSGCSRLLERPLNILIKAASSAGKNFVVDHSLMTFPEDAVRTLTSSSNRAWDYSENYFEHRIAYIKERNEASGAIHPARLLISEGKLERIVTVPPPV
jgi:hypothetical protein